MTAYPFDPDVAEFAALLESMPMAEDVAAQRAMIAERAAVWQRALELG